MGKTTRMKIRIQKEKSTFVLCFIMFFVSLFMEDIAFMNFDYNFLVKVMKTIVIIVSTIILLKQKWEKVDLLKAFTVIGFGFLVLLFTGDFFWLIATLLAFASRNIDKKTIFKTSLILIILLSLITFVLWMTGILPNIYTYRNDPSGIKRYSFGFSHSAVLPLCIFYLSTYYVMMKKDEKCKIAILLLLGLSSIAAFIFCGSRNGLLSTIFVVTLTILEPLLHNNKIIMKTLSFLAKHIGIICFAIAILPGLLRYYGVFNNFWDSFDTVFTNRSSTASSAVSTYGIHLFNNMSYNDFANKTISVGLVGWNGIVLDSAYVYILIRYGVIVLAFLWLILKSLYEDNSKSYKGYIIIILIALANVIDNDLISYGALPFILIGIRSLRIIPKGQKRL